MSIRGLIDKRETETKKDEEQEINTITDLINTEKDEEDNNIEKDFSNEKNDLVITETKDKTKIPTTNEVYLGRYYDIKNLRNNQILELDKLTDEKVKLDLTRPQIIVICGKIGSGKTYTAGIVIEEYLKNNRDMALIVLDIMGIYYSIKYPNIDREGADLWRDVPPFGFKDYVEVLVPEGDKDKYPKGTYDSTISLKPNQIKFDAWLELFQIKRTSPQGIVLEQIFRRLVLNNNNIDFSIDDLIGTLDSLETEAQMMNRSTFHKASATSIRGKLMAMQSWGIFSQEKGLEIRDIVKKGKCIVIDISNSEKSIGALLCSFIADRIYEERSKLAAQSSHERLGLEIEETTEYIPPVTLFLEEAHNYLPAKRGEENFNIQALRKYIKQGRSPGLSLFLVTQEPGDLDSKALKQIYGVIIGNLTHKEDFEKLRDMSPLVINKRWESLIRVLKPGQAVISFMGMNEPKVAQMRRRHSAHIARTETITDNKSSNEEILKIPQIKFEDLSKLSKLKELEKKLETIKKDKEELEKTIKEYKNENKNLKTQVDELLIKNEILNNQLNEKKEELNNFIKQFSTISENNSGIILGTFDEDVGYTAKYVKSNFYKDENSDFINKITKKGMGLGTNDGIFNFKFNDYKVYGERFEIENIKARGNKEIYCILIFTNKNNFNITEPIISDTINSLQNNITNYSIIDNLFNSLFNITSTNTETNSLELMNTIENLQNELENSKNKTLELEKKIELITKEKELLEKIKNKYEEQAKASISTNSEDISILKKTIEAKDKELESQSKIIIDFSNKINRYKELVKLLEQQIDELKQSSTPQEEVSIPEETKKIKKEQTKKQDIETKQEPKEQPVDKSIKNEIEIETKTEIETDNLDEIKKDKHKAKNFDDIFYKAKLDPIVKSIIKDIEKLDDICYVILSIIEAKSTTTTISEISAIIDNVTEYTLKKHINKHLNNEKKKLIKVYKKGRENRYSSNLVNYIKQKIKKSSLNIDTLTDTDINYIYDSVVSHLDLSIIFSN